MIFKTDHPVKSDKMHQKIKHNGPLIIFLTGASGTGKTALVEAAKKDFPDISSVFLHFDSIGVPSEEDMIRDYGSGSNWQRVMTHQWIKKILTKHNNKDLVIFEGQVNLLFITSALKEYHHHRYKIILVHCDQKTRHERLFNERNQSELVNQDMDNWANFLKQQALVMNVAIIDTSQINLNEALQQFKQYIKDYLTD